jgi:hypothetical protein
MKGDFSRLTFQPKNHYRRVLMQQGRVEIDADGNEQIAIDDHIGATTSTDVIGQAGYPDGTLPDGTPVGGFALGIATNGSDLTISAGRMYVDGLLVENDAQTSLLTQPDMPGVTLAELSVTQSGVYAVYLDVWERLITALDNPLIRETALGGPDTSVRTKLVWQVKPYRVAGPPASGGASPTCASVGDPWVTAAATTGTLAASSAAPGSDLPCILPPETGYQSLQNQLFRVEIHTPGPDETATFKWSGENASVVCLITAPASSNGTSPPTTVTGPTFDVTGLNTDSSLGLTAGDWVELIDDSTELIAGAGTLYQVQTVTNGQVTLSITGTQPTVTLALHPKLRRWDESGTGLTSAGTITVTTAAPIELEGGVQVQFSKGIYQVGDYWLIPARTATSIQQGYVQWPVDTSNHPVQQPPVGIKHHYATLGLVEFTEPGTFAGIGAASAPTDCRLPFPPLTGLTPQQSLSPCTIVVQPGAGWEQPILNYFAQAPSQGETASPRDAEICFPVGKFPASAPLVIANAGNIRVNGAGWGTQLIGASGTGGPEAVLQFQGCASVAVRDLYAETSVVTSARTDAARSHINGTLTFTDCAEVDVDGVWLRCGSAVSTRGAACITVSSDITDANATTGAGSVRIRGCRLDVGDMQVGIQLVHQSRAVVQDNEIRVDPKAPQKTLAERLNDPGYLAAARTQLLASMSSAATAGSAPAAATTPATPPPSTPPPAPSPGQPPTQRMRVTPASSPPPAPTSPAAPSGSTPPAAGQAKVVGGLAAPVVSSAVLNVGNQKISIAASQALASTWQAWLDENAPKEFGTQTDAANYLKTAANTILTEAASRAGMSAFGGVVRGLVGHVPLASRGIVVGGRTIGDLHIADNAVTGVLMGISVGVSHASTTKGKPPATHQRTPDHMQTIRIVDNVIGCVVNDVGAKPTRGPARFGIFVGSANSLDIEANRITTVRETIFVGAPADAIRVVGYLGAKAVIRGNHTSNFAMGIRVVPLSGNGPGTRVTQRNGTNPSYTQAITPGRQWLVIDNVIEGASRTASFGPFSRHTPPKPAPAPYIDAPACLQVNNVHWP